MAQSTVYKPAKPIDKHLDSKLIEKAYSFAVECHKTQKRHSGDPYISHPVAVADIVKALEGNIAGFWFLMEIEELEGRDKIIYSTGIDKSDIEVVL